ncbi:hypothetical protein HYH03_003324 [Edaphochlamys debaryana]|uniref:thiamine phosphate synthase n=1 Tax=Edaphochlamys debaryana TaxID=47281 RepID=A0A835Y9K0_9CHLO|nr:hypothetical protein HYH03_003324 [Edaphochlamys debaryana]|eukprot:KAG2498573.1 hypothetical protein HYH03_003324 [Edaphochlamys debaryana]
MAANAQGPPSGLPATTGLSLRLWDSVKHEVYMSLHEPFVQAMAQGTLDRRSFQHYVAQDAYFLHHFARAYALALAKAGAEDDATFEALSTLLRGVHAELKLHGAYAEGWGLALAKSQPSPATKAYTDFLYEVAVDPATSVAAVLAAMAPCARLYGFLGCVLARAHPHNLPGAQAGQQQQEGGKEGGKGAEKGEGDEHAKAAAEYREWVRTYCSPEYLAVPDMKEELLDRLAAGEDEAHLQVLYRRAMQLEAEFWAAQPHRPPPRRLRALVVDFDETATPGDTIGALMRLAQEAVAQGRPNVRGDAAWAASAPGRLAEGYVARQRELLASLLPPEGEEPSAPRPFDPSGLASFLTALSDFDESMNAVVEAEGVLAGSTEAEQAAAGAQVALRPHCREALAGALRRGVPVWVVSVNWSHALVRAVLGLPCAGPEAEGPGEGSARSGAVELRCNSLELGPDGLTSGRLTKRVQSARDKQAQMQRIKAKSPTDNDQPPAALVYVGDSASDLAALLDADYGIVVGTNRLLRRVAAAYGIVLRPLAAAPLDPTTVPAGTLYEADGWEEIRAFLFGVERPTDADASASAPVAPGDATGRAKPSAGANGAAHAAGASAAAVGSAAWLPRVLSIAGSDSGGGAGIQADIKAIQARGAFAMTALTALTAQNTRGVAAVHPVPLGFLGEQIDAVLGDLGADAIKTGMLPTAEAVEAVAERIAAHRAALASASPSAPCPPLVVDPVLVSTSGHSLAEGSVAGALLRRLLPMAALATPNIPEAEALLGWGPIASVPDMRRAAQELQEKTGCGAVLVKGGHLRPSHPGPGAHGNGGGGGLTRGWCGTAVPVGGHEAVDVLYDGVRHTELRGAWVDTGNTHGTGCTLASAIAAELAKGLPLLPAVTAARAALAEALRASAPLRLGGGVQRPFHHLHMLPPASAPAPPFTFPASSAAAPYSSLASPAADVGGAGSGDSAGASGAFAPQRRYDPALLRRQLALYAVTDPGCNDRTGRSMAEAVAAAVAGGATIIQLREKDTEGGAFLRAAAEALPICRAAGVPLIINDRVDVALAVGAEGVHVGQGDLPAAVVRALIGPSRILGVSCKTPEEARAAVAAGADYLGSGAALPTGTKDTGVIGWSGIRAVCEAAAPVPVVAIGGVGRDNAGEAVASGCAGVAVVSAIFGALDAEEAARGIREAVEAALQRGVGAEGP